MTKTSSTTNTPSATATVLGKLELTNDLGGSATAPTVVATHLAAALPVVQGGTGVTTSTGSGNTVLSNTPTLTTAVLGSSTATTQTPSDNSTKVATTAYVDNAILGQNFKEACKYASTGALPSIVYANGSSGVGATLTGVALAAISLDSSSPAVNDRVLIKNQGSTFQNGIYTVTATGSGIAVFVLTRATDADQSGEYKTGDSVFITAGSTLSTTTWAYTGIDSPTMGTDAITYVQVAGQGSFTGGNGITITGTSIAIDTSITVDKTTVQTLTNKTLTTPTISATGFTNANHAHTGATSGGQISHASLANLSSDDHTQYSLLAGRSGGQTLNGGTDANDDLTLRATAHATKTTAYLLLQDTGGAVVIGSTTPSTGGLFSIRGVPASTYGFQSETDSAGRGFQVVTTDYVNGSAGSTLSMQLGNGTGDVNALMNSFTVGKTASGDVILQSLSHGNVGIDQVSPAAKLDVSQGTLGTAVMSLSSVATNDDPTELVYQNRVATTNATVTTIHTFTIPASTTYGISGVVVARRTGGSAGTADDGAMYTFDVPFKNVAGTATVIGPGVPVGVGEDQAAWNCTFSPSGATVRLQVTGATNNNITWHMTARVCSVGT